jgi:benzoyl-CoA reductase/2-hydroxyglutaryl-CoA dehydratase subunit BcrC/BadD/HgdB
MAVWQFDFFAVKSDKAQSYKKTNEEFDDLISWNGFEINETSLLDISKVLSTEESWTKDILQFGKTDETCLTLFKHEDMLIEVSCRVDVRNVKSNEIYAIIQFLKNNDACIFVNGNIYDASIESLSMLIKQSNAYAFCKNPIDFLENL